LVNAESAIASLSVQLGTDASQFALDGPLPEIPETNASKSARERLVEKARRENLTVRQLAQYVGGSYGSLEMIGTPAMIADEMEAWLRQEGADGFNIMFPFLPEGLEDFVDTVIPELQRRGIFRTAYEGRTLRENLGLRRPGNRFFAG
jgi:alkanesulfonate monooxygenase SsuD/methylene tetrahydromethanopterin reductase-like flavin-dependent oxidoreductase (luciferase family)